MKFSNTKKGRVYQAIYDQIMSDLSIENLKEYKAMYPNHLDYALYQKGEVLFYVEEVKDLYKEYSLSRTSAIEHRYKRDLRHIVDLVLSA